MSLSAQSFLLCIDNRLLEGDLFIVEELWCISAADVNVRGTGLKAKIKITCKEVQSSVFLPVSITTSSTIDILGFKAEASYLCPSLEGYPSSPLYSVLPPDKMLPP